MYKWDTHNNKVETYILYMFHEFVTVNALGNKNVLKIFLQSII